LFFFRSWILKSTLVAEVAPSWLSGRGGGGIPPGNSGGGGGGGIPGGGGGGGGGGGCIPGGGGGGGGKGGCIPGGGGGGGGGMPGGGGGEGALTSLDLVSVCTFFLLYSFISSSLFSCWAFNLSSNFFPTSKHDILIISGCEIINFASNSYCVNINKLGSCPPSFCMCRATCGADLTFLAKFGTEYGTISLFDTGADKG